MQGFISFILYTLMLNLQQIHLQNRLTMKLFKERDQTDQRHKIIQQKSFIDKMMENYVISKTENAIGSPILAKINAKFSLRVGIQAMNSYLEVTGILIKPNGAPVSVPEQYRSLLLKYLLRQNQTPVKYRYDSQTNLLKVKSSLKYDKIKGTSKQQIMDCITTFSTIFPTLAKGLDLIGINQKYSPKSLKLRKAKLELLREVNRITSRDAEQIKVIPSSDYSLSKGCVFKFCKDIQECSQGTQTTQSLETSIKTGGYFQIQKKSCLVGDEKETFKIQLAVKEPRQDRASKIEEGYKKIQKQFRILKEIGDKKHSLTYWRKQHEVLEDSKKIYMDYASQTLYYYIYSGFNHLQNFLEFSEQIVTGVQILHRSGIVHRDLKPQNMVIEQGKDQKVLKIIDFGESALISDEFKQSKQCILGSTLPYSPVECCVASAESFNNKQIDYWSVGIILHELFFKTSPLSYSKCFASDIYKGWRMSDQFSIFPNITRKAGMQFCSYIISVLSSRSICIKQSERLPLDKTLKVLKVLTKFILACFR